MIKISIIGRKKIDNLCIIIMVIISLMVALWAYKLNYIRLIASVYYQLNFNVFLRLGCSFASENANPYMTNIIVIVLDNCCLGD